MNKPFIVPVAPLFVPGDRPDLFAKAAASGADAIIMNGFSPLIVVVFDVDGIGGYPGAADESFFVQGSKFKVGMLIKLNNSKLEGEL